MEIYLKRIPQLLSLSLAACLLFAGCGGDQPGGSKEMNFVRVRLAAEPDYINPIITVNAYSRMVFSGMYQSLLDFDPYTMELVPVLATGRPIIENIDSGPYAGGISYTFEIRPEADWDDGRPITGEDIAFTLKTYFHPGIPLAAPGRSVLESFVDVVADPNNPKEFTIVSNTRYFLGEAAIGTLSILPAHVYDPDGVLKKVPMADWNNPEKAAAMTEASPELAAFAEKFMNSAGGRAPSDHLGSGPYSLVSWETGQRIILKRKANWWADKVTPSGPGLRAYPDSLVYVIIQDQTTAVTALKAQEIDVMTQIDAKEYVNLLQDENFKSMFTLHNPEVFQVYYIGINMKNPKLNDKRVRRAVAQSLDIDALIEQLFFGLAKRVVGPFHPAKSLYNKDLKLLSYDPDQARALLKEAGWEDTNGNGTVDKNIGGQLTELELDYLTTAGSTMGQNIALLFQQNAAKSGIKINIQSLNPDVMRQSLDNRTFELFGRGWSTDGLPDDPSQYWARASDRPGGGNYFGFGTEESDSLIEQIKVTMDDQARNKLYYRLQEIIYDEQPCIFLLAPQERIAISNRFKARTSATRPSFFVSDFELQE